MHRGRLIGKQNRAGQPWKLQLSTAKNRVLKSQVDVSSNRKWRHYEIIGDPVITDVIRDRLEHAALVVQITGESCRGVEARKLASKKKDA